MNNKLMLICLSVMTAGFIRASVVPTLIAQQLATQIGAASVSAQVSHPAYCNSKYNKLWEKSRYYLFNKPQSATTCSTFNIHNEGSYDGVWKSYAHNCASKSSTHVPNALVTTSHLPFVMQAAQKKLAQAATGSVNPDVITVFHIRSVKRSPDNLVNFYGRTSGWKKAFAKAFAPIAGLFGAATADCMNSSASEVQEIAAPVMQTPVASIVDTSSATPSIVAPATPSIVAPATPSIVAPASFNSRFGYFPHDGKVATTIAVAAVFGLSCAVYKAYQKGYFSKWNPFSKATQVRQEIKTNQQSVMQEPVVQQRVAQAPQQVVATTQAVSSSASVVKTKRPVAPRVCPKCHERH